MTKKELQTQINFLIDELKKLSDAYKKLSDEAFNNRINKNKFYGMWRKADEKADRYGGLLVTLHQLIQPHYTGEDVDLSAIRKLIEEWYESEIIK